MPIGSPVLIKYIKSNEKRTALNFNLYPRMIEENYRGIKKHENILEKNKNWFATHYCFKN